MPIDPRLNCAAEICCAPPDSIAAAASILRDMGVAEDDAPKMAAKMKEMGITFTSTAMAQAIAEIADHPARETAKGGGS